MRSPPEKHVADVLAEYLHSYGVTVFFNLVGGQTMPLYLSLTMKSGVKAVDVRHEAAAVGMADGYVRCCGGIGIAVVSQGPGFTNTLTALTEAVKAGSSILVILGTLPRGVSRHNQLFDHASMAKAAGALFMEITSPITAQPDIHRAIYLSQLRQEPVVLAVGSDVLSSPCNETGPLPVLSLPPPAAADNMAIETAAELMGRRSKPLIIAGRGAVQGNAIPELNNLGSRIGALMATTTMAKGAFAGNDWHIGISGSFSNTVARELIPQADLVLAFGASLNQWTLKQLTLIDPSKTPVIHCDTNLSALGAITPVSLAIQGDAKLVARQLIRAADNGNVSSEGFRTDTTRAFLDNFQPLHDFTDETTEEYIDPRTLMIALNEILPAERSVSVDVGHFNGFPSRYLDMPDGRGYLFISAFQSVGLGLAPAFGAAMARPDRLSVAVIGDGGLLMCLGELETLSRYRWPMLVIVMNDAAYGAETHFLNMFDLPPVVGAFPPSDFAAVAETFNVRGITVRGKTDLSGLRAWLVDTDGPLLLDCKINPQVCADWYREAFEATGQAPLRNN